MPPGVGTEHGDRERSGGERLIKKVSSIQHATLQHERIERTKESSVLFKGPCFPYEGKTDQPRAGGRVVRCLRRPRAGSVSLMKRYGAQEGDHGFN